MRGHVVLGSTDGWLVTADAQATLRMANPVPFFSSCGSHILDRNLFAAVRFGGLPNGERRPPLTLAKWQMRNWFYRKAVLSTSPRPGRYAAMLILAREFGAPAFATAGDPAWRLAPSRDGVEDAIHHEGRFYSVTYAGVVEEWDGDAETGEFTSTPVAPGLPGGEDVRRRKYIAAAPDGRLMAVLKLSMEVEQQHHCKITRVSFGVQVLDQASGRSEVVASDIGDDAVFVGVNGTVCVSTREHPGIAAGCIYFTDDEVGDACLMRKEQSASCNQRSSSIYGEPDDTELRETGVYSLKAGKVVNRIPEQGKHRRWSPQAWFSPSFL